MSKREAMLRGLCLRWGVIAMQRAATAKEVSEKFKHVRTTLMSSSETLEECRAELETVLGIRNQEPPAP